MAYIKSKNIKMYPSGYRGLLNNGIKKSYNPESKLNVESNAIRSLKTLLTYGKGDFVITENYSWNEAADHSSTYNYFNFEFICGGYYFKIIDSYDAFKDLLSQTGVTALYAAISFAYMNVFIPESESDGRTIDVNNIYITDPHLKNQKPGESVGKLLTPSNLNDDASNIIDLSSLDQQVNQEDCFTGVSLSTSNDDTNLHYFKILEKDSNGNFVVPQEAKLITDTKHIWGGEDTEGVKCLHDLLETKKVKSPSTEDLTIESDGDVVIKSNSDDIILEADNVKFIDSDNTTTEIKGNEIDTTTIKGYTDLTLACETASSTLTLKSPKVQLVNDNTKLLVEYTPDKFSIKKQTSGFNYLSFTNDNGFVIANSDTSADSDSQVKITNDKIEVWGEDVTTTKIYKDEIQTEDICLTNQKPDSGYNALQISSIGYISKVALSATHTTPSTTQIVDYVSGITQAANGAITYSTSTLPKIGETSTTLQGIAKVNSVRGTVGNAHARWINSTADSTGGKLYVGEVNTLIDNMVSNKEYHLIAEKEVDQDNWFKTGCFSNLITINSNGRVSASSFYATSDKRLKENIKPLNYDKSILDLPVYTYDYIDGQKNNIGCLAQDLQKLYPQLIGENSNGYLTVDNSKVVYLLLEEVKLLKKELDEIKTKLK